MAVAQTSALHLQLGETFQAAPSEDAGRRRLRMTWFFQGMGLAALMLIAVAAMGVWRSPVPLPSDTPSGHDTAFTPSLQLLRAVGRPMGSASKATSRARPQTITMQAQKRPPNPSEPQGAALPGSWAPSSFRARRDVIGKSVAALAGLALGNLVPPAYAEEDLVDIYFGVGCFWHVQHEFIEAERRILGRTDKQLTARAGYAGGKTAGKDASMPGKELVCYHNGMMGMGGIADYGKLGHGEVVGLRVPAASVGEFAKEYAKLFDKNGDRPDKGDRGGEYRSLIGLPGGVKSPLLAAVDGATTTKGLKLAQGSGNDGDTLGQKKVWVYDTKDYPFYQGEVYHQYHDGFMPGEQYGKAYNSLRATAYKEERLLKTGCPDIV